MQSNSDFTAHLKEAVSYCRGSSDPKFISIAELLITAISRVDFKAAQEARAIASGSTAAASMVNTTGGRFSTTPKGLAGNPLVAGQVRAAQDMEKKSAAAAEADSKEADNTVSSEADAKALIETSGLATIKSDSQLEKFFASSTVAEITAKYSKEQLLAVAESMGISVQKRMSANIIASAIKHKLG